MPCLLRSLTIGHLKTANNVFLAPLAGITDYPFRQIARQFGAGLTYSEMIASQAVVRSSERSAKMASTAKQEYPLAVQIFGSDPVVMAEAAKVNQGLGAAMIDINMGCPQRKIVKTGAGAALMLDPDLAACIVERVVKSITIPVTVKMRLGWDPGSINAPSLARMVERAGASLITVHGRTRGQMFAGKADWKAIGHVKKAVGCPVIANGDITTPEDALDCLEISGADGIMIGRGALGRPWIFREVTALLNGKAPAGQEDLDLVFNTALQHIHALEAFYGEPVAVWMARKHLAWYTKGLKEGSCFRKAVNSAKTINEISRLLADFFVIDHGLHLGHFNANQPPVSAHRVP